MGTIIAGKPRKPPLGKSSLVQIVRRIVAADVSGANVQELLGGAVLVTDCPSWRQEHTSLLTLLRPNVCISVASCCSSLSGFAVNISEPAPYPRTSLRALLAVAIAMLGGVAAVTVFVYNPLLT